VLIRREGYHVNKKLVYRVYREEKLSLRVRKRKRIAALVRVPLPAPEKPNVRWSMDFVSDQLGSTGRRFRCLTIVDDFSRECLAIEVDTSLPGSRVARVLERLAFSRGLPQAIVVDNGPEFTGRSLDAWAFEKGIKLDYIRPGKPVENAYIESFNGKFRDECLNEHWFVTLREAQVRIEAWREDYNCKRPHSSLGDLTPEQFAKTVA
jgi:putative transposase